MSKLSIACILITVFLLLGPYFGVHILGDPESRFIEKDGFASTGIPPSYDLRPGSTLNTDLRYLDSEQDDLMEQVPADELLIE